MARAGKEKESLWESQEPIDQVFKRPEMVKRANLGKDWIMVNWIKLGKVR